MRRHLYLKVSQLKVKFAPDGDPLCILLASLRIFLLLLSVSVVSDFFRFYSGGHFWVNVRVAFSSKMVRADTSNASLGAGFPQQNQGALQIII